MDKRPDNLVEHDTIMSNCFHEIESGSEEYLKLNDVYGCYAGWNFHGTVWFDKSNNIFKCQVKQYRQHVATIEGNSLSDIMKNVSDRFGWE